MKYNIFYHIHLLLVIFVILTPLAPLYLLKYLFILPLLIYTIWVIFNNCPINILHRSDKNSKDENFFVHDVLKTYINKDITRDRSHIISAFVSVGLVTISAFRFLYKI